MNTGVNTSTVIHIKRNKRKEIAKPIECNCKDCVNHGRKGCHYKWVPINGKCNRYGKNDYKPTNEEKEQSKEKQKIFRDKENEGKIRGLETVTVEKVDLSKWNRYR